MDDRLPSIAENDQKEEDYQSMDVGIPLLDAKRKMMAPSVYSEAMSRKELEIVRADKAKEEWDFKGKDKCFSWAVLMILLLAQVSNQW